MKRADLSLSASDGTLLIERVKWTEGFRERCRGLIGQHTLGRGRGMALVPCRAVHTCFMRFSLDVIFFSRDFRVVHIAECVVPYRIVWGGWTAWGVVEVQSGWFPWNHLRTGDRLVFSDTV